MATKPKAILSTHDGREASPITKASNVLFENGQTAQDILNDRQDAMISPVIENSSSMFKVGQGDNVDYSANVVNGAYESMVLKGKSMVNCIQEPSSQDVVLPYEFADGQYVTINDTKESGALGVELKGQTLVNLVGERREYNNASLYGWEFMLPYKLTKDARYMVVFNASGTITGNSKVYLMDNGFGSNSGNTPYPVSFTLGYNKHITTASGDNHKVLRIRTDSQAVNDLKVSDVMLIPYQEGMENWDIPYFEGMTSCKMPILHTVGKNLSPINDYETTVCEYAQGYQGFNKVLAKNILVNENKEYRLSFTKECENGLPTNLGNIMIQFSSIPASSNINDHNAVYVHCRNNKGKKYAHITMPNIGEGNEYVGKRVTLTNIQLEEGSVATPYEPYKTSILSLPEEVVLGGLGNTRDTFNTTTGNYTKRTDTKTVTNYKNSLGSSVVEGAWSIVVAPPNKKWQSTTLCVSDKFSMGGGHSNRDCGFYENPANFVFFDKTVNSADEFIAKYGDFSFTYILETPVVTKINLPSTLKSWNTTTHIYSEIPENTLHPTLTHSNPTYPVILKPSTKYSIVANSYSNSHTNSAINFNLGGATASTTVGNRVTTITTPSTLSNELLTMSGRGNKLNNVMVIEGDVVGDEPYFEGICDSKSPILSNVGKNLYNKERSKVFSHSHVVFDGEKVSFIQSSNRFRLMIDGAFKEKTKYAIRYEVVSGRGSVLVVYDDGTWTRIEGRLVTDGNKTIDRIESEWTDGSTSIIKNIQIEESSSATTYEPYKSNILSCNGDKIELTEDMFEQGTTAPYVGNPGKTYQWLKENSTPSFDVRRLRLKELIKIQPNTKLILQNTDNFMYAIAGYDANKLSLGTFDTSWIQNTTITIPQDAHYISFSIRKKDDTGITINDFKNTNFTLSEVDKTIVLRSLPNGVCDTLNVETGEYVQRIGEIVLDGKNDVEISISHSSNRFPSITRFWVRDRELSNLAHYSNTIMCDKLPVRPDGDYEKITCSNGLDIHITTSKLSEETVEAFKEYLSQNPITVQYPLTTPIASTIDVQGFPFSYENGHVILSSGSIEQSLTPKVEYSVATNRNGQIRSNQKMVERHQKQLDQLQAIILANLVNSQYNQTLATLKYELSRV